MRPLGNIDKLLEEWNQIKSISTPVSITADEAIKFTNIKDNIANTVHALQVSRLQNNSTAEKFYSQQFFEIYNKFNKEYMFKVLKNV